MSKIYKSTFSKQKCATYLLYSLLLLRNASICAARSDLHRVLVVVADLQMTRNLYAYVVCGADVQGLFAVAAESS